MNAFTLSAPDVDGVATKRRTSRRIRAWRVHIILVATSVVALTACRHGAAGDPERTAASALFSQFETVYSINADMLRGAGSYQGIAALDAQTLGIPFGYLPRSLDVLGTHVSADILANSSALLVGAKDFRAPTGLGGVRSRSSCVIVFRPQSVDVRAHFRQASATSIGDTTVWQWSVSLGEFGERDSRPSTRYAAQVGRSYLVISNDLRDLQMLDTRLRSSGDPLSEGDARIWEATRQRDVWAYRRYRHQGVADRVAAGMHDVTPGAEALLLAVDTQNKSAVLRLFQAAGDERTTMALNARGGLPPFRLSGAGAWETTFPLTGDEPSLFRLAIALGLLGFATYV